MTYKQHRRLFNFYNLFLGTVAILMVTIITFGLATLLTTECNDGFWVRDMSGVPRCIKNQNVNILMH